MLGWMVDQGASRGRGSSAGSAEKYLIVSLGAERFGVPVSRVKEIIECAEIVALPMAPPAVRGTINLRGRVVPVVDLAVRFGRGPMTMGRRSCIVIAEIDRPDHQPFDVGLLVDAVNQVVDIGTGDIEAAPSMDGAIRTDFALGMGKVNESFVLLLRIEALVALDEFVGITTVPAAGTAEARGGAYG